MWYHGRGTERSKPGQTQSPVFYAWNIQGEFAEANRSGSFLKLSPIEASLPFNVLVRSKIHSSFLSFPLHFSLLSFLMSKHLPSP